MERAPSPPTPSDRGPSLLLLDVDNVEGHQGVLANGHGNQNAGMAMTTTTTTTTAGLKLEEKIKELKLRDLALREDRSKERERRKEAERQLKAAQKERYIQGLKVKYLETKLEKVGGNKSDMEKRVRHESQANASLQKEVDVLRAKLAERERALAERDEALVKVKRQYARLKQGGSDDCSLAELEEMEKVLEKSRNLLLDRIKQRVKEEMDDKAKCLICFDRTKAIIFVPCGHKVCCATCSSQVRICPVCRANIEIKQKVFE
jgi:chromosome segregation ATPase